MSQYIIVKPTDPTPFNIVAALGRVSAMYITIGLHRGVRIKVLRVEKIPVPIIWLTFKHKLTHELTEYPNGDCFSTGAPLASW